MLVCVRVSQRLCAIHPKYAFHCVTSAVAFPRRCIHVGIHGTACASLSVFQSTGIFDGHERDQTPHCDHTSSSDAPAYSVPPQPAYIGTVCPEKMHVHDVLRAESSNTMELYGTTRKNGGSAAS